MKKLVFALLAALTFGCNSQVQDMHFGPGPSGEEEASGRCSSCGRIHD